MTLLGWPGPASSAERLIQLICDGDGSQCGGAGTAPKNQDGSDQPAQQQGVNFEQADVAVCPPASPGAAVHGMAVMIGSFGQDGYGLGPDCGTGNGNDKLQLAALPFVLDPVKGPVYGKLQYIACGAQQGWPGQALTGGTDNRDGMNPKAICVAGTSNAFYIKANHDPEGDGQQDTITYGLVGINPGLDASGAVGKLGAGSNAVEILHRVNDDCDNAKYEQLPMWQRDSRTVRIGQVFGCNGNGEDAAWANFVDIRKTDNPQLPYELVTDQNAAIQIVEDEERTRATIHPTSTPYHAVILATAGNNQPPRIGVSYITVDFGGNAPRRLAQEVIAPYSATPDGVQTYQTEVTSSLVGDNQVLLSWQKSTGQRRKGKGSQTLVNALGQVQPDGTLTLVQGASPNLVPGFDATHRGQCEVMWGETGKERKSAFIISSSVNGTPGSSATAAVLQSDGGKMQVVDKVNLGVAIDNQWLSNVYGQNPGNQGRNFVYCEQADNPGHGVPGGFQPDVKSFVVVAATTRRQRQGSQLPQAKLGLEMVLIPAVVDPGATGGPGGNNAGAPGATDPDESGTSSSSGGGKSAGGCQLTGSSSGGLLALFALAGLALAVRRRGRSAQ
jgi:hypothetical protein